ncbi:unnamed protein product [Ectocarpus sp. 12 AP-2014]
MIRARAPASSSLCRAWIRQPPSWLTSAAGIDESSMLRRVSWRTSTSSSTSNSSNSSNISGSSSSESRRSYLERWAGIRGSPASPASRSAEAPSPPVRTSPVSLFGRTYLLSTIKVPPFSTATTLTGSNPANSHRVNGAAAGGEKEEDEEEERVFECMREALQGPGALGTTGLFPGAGSPVVLDLGAVSQDGSPHGRPAGRASLAGCSRAVRAAGLVPVGVCNASHDVLKTASEQGLPEVMMVHARPRSSPPQVAASRSTRNHSAEQTVPVRASDAEESVAQTPPSAAPSGASAPAPATTAALGEGEEGRRRGGSSCSGAVPAPATAGEEGEDRNDDSERSGTSLSEEGGDRETMVYRGSVRSGQQVFAEGTSLVVLGAVSSGGEVMADGDIHVYGTLRGRALAGLSGKKSAKIFAARFDAELVGVGESFTTLDSPESLDGLVVDAPTNVYLRENELVFHSFDLSAASP